jgi:hypothetical protein
MRRRVPAALGLFGLLLVGCGGAKIVPVSGVVTLDGKPYKNGIVSFQPIGSMSNPNVGRGSSGVTDENGKFTLIYDGDRPGALVGKHRVRIFTKLGGADTEGEPNRPAAKGEAMFEPIPAEWHEQSEKEFDVPAGGTRKANFDIETGSARKQ